MSLVETIVLKAVKTLANRRMSKIEVQNDDGSVDFHFGSILSSFPESCFMMLGTKKVLYVGFISDRSNVFFSKASDGKKYVFKMLTGNSYASKQHIKKEVRGYKHILSCLTIEPCKYINNIYFIEEGWDHTLICMEYGGFDAFELCTSFNMSWQYFFECCKGAYNGLLYMHKHNLVHRDVKPENLAVNKDGLCQLIDFGMSNKFDSANLVIEGTFQYIPPFVFNEREKTEMTLRHGTGFTNKLMDYYAFSLTVLALVGIFHKIDKLNQHQDMIVDSSMDIEFISKLYLYKDLVEPLVEKNSETKMVFDRFDIFTDDYVQIIQIVCGILLNFYDTRCRFVHFSMKRQNGKKSGSVMYSRVNIEHGNLRNLETVPVLWGKLKDILC